MHFFNYKNFHTTQLMQRSLHQHSVRAHDRRSFGENLTMAKVPKHVVFLVIANKHLNWRCCVWLHLTLPNFVHAQRGWTPFKVSELTRFSIQEHRYLIQMFIERYQNNNNGAPHVRDSKHLRNCWICVPGYLSRWSLTPSTLKGR
jgi:hypothetical protein